MLFVRKNNTHRKSKRIFWYFNEEDIIRYLTTDDDFDLHFVINNHEFTISSDLYWLLENQFNFNFHKASYRIHIYQITEMFCIFNFFNYDS